MELHALTKKGVFISLGHRMITCKLVAVAVPVYGKKKLSPWPGPVVCGDEERCGLLSWSSPCTQAGLGKEKQTGFFSLCRGSNYFSFLALQTFKESSSITFSTSSYPSSQFSLFWQTP